MENIETYIFTDGSSRGNPGPGGWGAVLVMNSQLENQAKVMELGGREDITTNNRMELMAAIKALSSLPNVISSIIIFTDSSYLINGITKWIHGWKKNGWKTKTKDDVLNIDLWQKLDSLIAGQKIHWKHIRGHEGVVGNERCDEIATGFADNYRVDLYEGQLSNYRIPQILNISSDNKKVDENKSKSSRSRAKAYSYISRVKGVIEKHHSWPECEKRVKGVAGAKFKKSLNAEDEKKIIQEYSA